MSIPAPRFEFMLFLPFAVQQTSTYLYIYITLKFQKILKFSENARDVLEVSNVLLQRERAFFEQIQYFTDSRNFRKIYRFWESRRL